MGEFIDEKVQERIGYANTFYPYVGKSAPIHIDSKRRIRLAPPFKFRLSQRAEYFGIRKRSLMCRIEQSSKDGHFSCWDYHPKGKNCRDYKLVNIDSNGRITLPNDISVKGKKAVIQGERDHIEIHLQD